MRRALPAFGHAWLLFEHLTNELPYRLNRGFKLIALRGVAAIREGKNFDRTGALGRDGLDLLHRAVLIVEALNNKHRAGDPRKIFFNIPAAEIRMQPDIVPSPECSRNVAMMARQFFREVRRLKFHLGFGNRCNTEILDKNMRRQKDEPADAALRASVNNGDRRPIAVADQNGILDLEILQKVGENFQALLVHVTDCAWFGEHVGISRAVTRVDCHSATCCLGNPERKRLPV